MCRELPYNLRTVAELECEPEWVQAEYLGHELVPGGGVSTLPGAPGTHQDADGAVSSVERDKDEAAPSVQDADGAVEAPADGAAGTAVGVPPGEWPGAAPSVQAPAAPAYGRTDPALRTARRGAADGLALRVGRGGGPDIVLWAATLTALVITTVYAAVRVAQWHLLIGKEWSP